MLCAYCTEPATRTCETCDRRLCWEHSHGDAEVPVWFCEPLPDDTVARYRATGEVPQCGEGAR